MVMGIGWALTEIDLKNLADVYCGVWLGKSIVTWLPRLGIESIRSYLQVLIGCSTLYRSTKQRSLQLCFGETRRAMKSDNTYAGYRCL